MSSEIRIKLTKRFDEMGKLETLAEAVKMFFFGGSVADSYMQDVGYYNYMMKEYNKRKENTVSLDVMLMKRRLLENQKLLAKYNYEDFILGLEVIDRSDKEYEDLIEPYKVKGKDWKSKVFTFLFKENPLI